MCKVQTGRIAGSQLHFLLAKRLGSHHNGADGVYDILRREVETGGNPSAACGLFRSVHHLLTRQPQLHARCRMNGIVNTAVHRHKAPQHLRIGGIDDGIHLEASDIPLPLFIDPSSVFVLLRMTGVILSEAKNLHHPFLRQLRLQLLVLQPQERL